MSIARSFISVIDALYVPPFSRLVSREIFGYGLCGALNMALDTLWYFVIYHYIIAERFIDLGFVLVSPHIASLVVVFPITFFTGFWLNKYVAFRVTDYSKHNRLIRYAFSVLGSIILNYVSMKLLVEYFMLWPTPSKMLTTLITACYSFLAAKFYTFK